MHPVRMRELFPPTMSLPGVDMEIRDVDHETGATTLRFEVSEARANQFGSVQGGVVAIMLDACIGIAGAVRSGGVLAMPLAEMNVSFIRPAQWGTLIGSGIATRLGRKVGFIEGTLFDVDGRIVARGSGTAIPTPFPDTAAVCGPEPSPVIEVAASQPTVEKVAQRVRSLGT
jgi:uncharacterized protein (TIGR00369 family)